MNALLAATVFVVLGADGSQDERLSAEIVEAAERTAARLQKEGAKWTVRHDVEPGEAVEVAVEQFPMAAHFELRVIARGRRTKMFALTARDGVWYVDDGQSRGRYRPYEAPLPLPTGVHFLRNSEVPLLNKEALSKNSVVSIQTSGEQRLSVRMSGTEILSAESAGAACEPGRPHGSTEGRRAVGSDRAGSPDRRGQGPLVERVSSRRGS